MRLRRSKKRAFTSDHVLAGLGLSAALGIATILLRLAQDRASRRSANESFVLRSSQPLDREIRRTATFETSTALRRLTSDLPDVTSDTVHDSRKRMRKLRSLLRLTSSELGEKTFAREDQAVRSIAKRLSPARDGHVLVETLDALVHSAGHRVPAGAFDGLRAGLQREAQRENELLAAQVAGLNGLVGDLEALLCRIAEWELPEGRRNKALRKGLERIYRRGRGAHSAARAHKTDEESLHRLRRRTKDLRHAIELTNSTSRAAQRAHKLTALLGDEHDLAVLGTAARRHLITLDPGHEVLLEELIEEHRRELQRQARKLAKRVYSDKPRKAAERILRS